VRADVRRTDPALWVVMPVRGIAQGKSRLADTLDAVERARLNRWFLQNTLRVIGAWQGSLGRCIVVSACARTLAIAARAGAIALREPRPGRGLNGAVAAAAAYALRRGCRRLVVTACDLPRLSVEALDALTERPWSRARLALATDVAGTGTNALHLASRARFSFAFGAESRARHVLAARARGWTYAVATHPGLSLDIDRGNDLRSWRAQSASRTIQSRML
jgi:2-phospho-L-lactate guanylyltransferase